ncbi:MAG: TIR domain-containing protein, partial [Solirubrobacteraceae bacterium]
MAQLRPYVFLSYASSQRTRALEIARTLEEHGVSVWLDRQAIPGGTSWSAEIVRGIKGCAAIIVLCSDASLGSPNVQRELNLAVEEARPLLPLILEQAAAPDEVRYALAGRQWIELLDRPAEEWLPRVLDALSRFGIILSPGDAVELGPTSEAPLVASEPATPLSPAAPASSRPYWSQVLRALREARGITQDGWAARLAISRTTIQRWERGEYVPDALAEAQLLRVCQEQGLLRTFDRGALSGVTMSADLLSDLLA